MHTKQLSERRHYNEKDYYSNNARCPGFLHARRMRQNRNLCCHRRFHLYGEGDRRSGEALQNDTGISFTYNPTGSGSGIKAVQEGRCDIGLSSRDLKAEEKEAGLSGTVLAYDGIAIIVNPNNPVNDLSLEVLAKIYTGEITNWSEIGGNDAEIVLIGREASSGTREGFESVTNTKNACKYRQELTSTGDVITTVAQNPAAIGYASVASVKSTVKAVTIGGIPATEETIKDGSYAVQRPFVLVTKSDTPLSEAAFKFFTYITSSDACKIISAAGVVPAYSDAN